MHCDVVILGGGIAGLSAARSLGVEACLLEKETTLGGCLRSDRVGGYTIDRTGHLLHFNDPYVKRVMFEELNLEWLHFERKAQIRIAGRDVPYPIQYNLHALPESDRERCLNSYIETVKPPISLEGAFDDWAKSAFGAELNKLFFSPYNRKLFQLDMHSMSAEWAQRFIPMPNRDLIIRGAISPHSDTRFGYNADFSYPRQGGAQAIADALAKTIKVPMRTNAQVVAIDIVARQCELSDGSRVSYGRLINTIPLPELVALITRADMEVRDLVTGLKHNSIFYMALGFRTGGRRPEQHWVYVPEEKYAIYRAGILSNYAPSIAPPGSVLICAEMGCPGATAGNQDPADWQPRILEELIDIGLVDPSWQLEMVHPGSIDCAYVIYDVHRRRALPRIQGYLRQHGIYSIGRYGAWTYGSMGDALKAGYECAMEIQAELGHSACGPG